MSYTRCLVAFCAALISPAILVYGLPLAIGAGADLLTVAANAL